MVFTDYFESTKVINPEFYFESTNYIKVRNIKKVKNEPLKMADFT